VANAIQRDTFQQVVSIRNTTVDGYSMSLVINRTPSKATSASAAAASGHPPEPDRDPT
jgi:hypothetical protein